MRDWVITVHIRDDEELDPYLVQEVLYEHVTLMRDHIGGHLQVTNTKVRPVGEGE